AQRAQGRSGDRPVGDRRRDGHLRRPDLRNQVAPPPSESWWRVVAIATTRHQDPLLAGTWAVLGDVRGVLLLVRHATGGDHGVVLALGVVGDRADPDRCAVRADLGPPAGDLAVVEAHGHDPVRAALLSLIDHAAHRLVAAVEQQTGHLRNLTATD